MNKSKTRGDCLDELGVLITALGKGGEYGIHADLYGLHEVAVVGMRPTTPEERGRGFGPAIDSWEVFPASVAGFVAAQEAVRAWVLPSEAEQRASRALLAAVQQRHAQVVAQLLADDASFDDPVPCCDLAGSGHTEWCPRRAEYVAP